MGKTINIQHKEMSSGRWAKMSFCEQMANIGSEVSRALNWRAKKNTEYSQKAIDRAFELLDLTILPIKNYPRLKELLRLRECLADFFYGSNEFRSTELSWRRYFDPFVHIARR